ncbi:Nonsense-mediated mRNA decay factor SMG7-like protein [Drosera capensis]
MDKSTSWERAQVLYEQNKELETKRQKSVEARIPSDPNSWYQIRENHEAIILEDHDFSEKHAVEYGLWQLHYRRIEEFRALFAASQASGKATAYSRGRNYSQADRVMKIRVQFKNFLSEATGFYHELIVKICSKYGFPLAQLSGDLESHVISGGDGAKSSQIYKGLVSCHRCLIYLGDLARYKVLYGENGSRNRDFTAASRYYLQAASLLPSSGNPHNQLAILASYSGDDLATIYRYVRSLAAESPFINAKDNLLTAFEKNRQTYTQQQEKILEPQVNNTGGETAAKSTDGKYREFCIKFVRMNGILYTRTSLESFPVVLSLVKSMLHELISSGSEEEQNPSVGTAEDRVLILRVVTILIFTFQNVNKKAEGLTYAETLQYTLILQNASAATFELVGVMLERILQLRDSSSSFILPGLLSFLEWLACSPDVAAWDDMEPKASAAKLKFWKLCITFFNKLLSDGSASIDDDTNDACFTEMAKYEEGDNESRCALWEDLELRGFLPLLPAQTILDFSRRNSSILDGSNQEKTIRLKRILAAGKALMSVVMSDKQPMHFDSKIKQFVVGVKPQRLRTSMPESYVQNGSLIAEVKQAKAQFSYDGEEDDFEEILFQPSLWDKQQLDGSVLEAPGHLDNVRFQKAQSDAGSSLGIPMTNGVPQPRMVMELPGSSWSVQQQDTIADNYDNLSLTRNGLMMKSEGRAGLGISDVGPTMSFFNPPVNVNSGAIHSGHTRALEVGLSQVDSLGLVSSVDVALNTVHTAPVASKYQTSRPIRHLGPPPGFNFVPHKQIHAPLPSSDGRNETLVMDNLAGSQGNQLPSLGKGVGPIRNFNHLTFNGAPSSSNDNMSTGIPSYPFPVTRISALQMQGMNMRGHQNYQPFENLNLENSHNLNQQFGAIPEHHNVQSTWTGRYHV